MGADEFIMTPAYEMPVPGISSSVRYLQLCGSFPNVILANHLLYMRPIYYYIFVTFIIYLSHLFLYMSR